jgi:hypothetical protein
MTGVTWPDNWVINPFPVTPSSIPRPPPWVYKLTQDLVECAVPWEIYYRHLLLLLQPQQHASGEVSLQPDSPAHRHSLSTTPAWVHSYRWLLSESQSLCVVRADYKLSSPVSTRTFQYWNWAWAQEIYAQEIYALQILDLYLIPVLSFQQVKGNLSITTFELFSLIF